MKSITSLRPAARLLADELLGRAIEVARRAAGGIRGTGHRADHDTGVLAVHGRGITTDQAGGRCLRRYQWRRRKRNELPRREWCRQWIGRRHALCKSYAIRRQNRRAGGKREQNRDLQDVPHRSLRQYANTACRYSDRRAIAIHCTGMPASRITLAHLPISEPIHCAKCAGVPATIRTHYQHSLSAPVASPDAIACDRGNDAACRPDAPWPCPAPWQSASSATTARFT